MNKFRFDSGLTLSNVHKVVLSESKENGYNDIIGKAVFINDITRELPYINFDLIKYYSTPFLVLCEGVVEPTDDIPRLVVNGRRAVIDMGYIRLAARNRTALDPRTDVLWAVDPSDAMRAIIKWNATVKNDFILKFKEVMSLPPLLKVTDGDEIVLIDKKHGISSYSGKRVFGLRVHCGSIGIYGFGAKKFMGNALVRDNCFYRWSNDMEAVIIDNFAYGKMGFNEGIERIRLNNIEVMRRAIKLFNETCSNVRCRINEFNKRNECRYVDTDNEVKGNEPEEGRDNEG